MTSDPCKRTTLRALRVRYWSWVPPVAMLVSLPLALVVPMHEPTFGEKHMWGKDAWRCFWKLRFFQWMFCLWKMRDQMQHWRNTEFFQNWFLLKLQLMMTCWNSEGHGRIRLAWCVVVSEIVILSHDSLWSIFQDRFKPLKPTRIVVWYWKSMGESQVFASFQGDKNQLPDYACFHTRSFFSSHQWKQSTSPEENLTSLIWTCSNLGQHQVVTLFLVGQRFRLFCCLGELVWFPFFQRVSWWGLPSQTHEENVYVRCPTLGCSLQLPGRWNWSCVGQSWLGLFRKDIGSHISI